MAPWPSSPVICRGCSASSTHRGTGRTLGISATAIVRRKRRIGPALSVQAQQRDSRETPRRADRVPLPAAGSLRGALRTHLSHSSSHWPTPFSSPHSPAPFSVLQAQSMVTIGYTNYFEPISTLTCSHLETGGKLAVGVTTVCTDTIEKASLSAPCGAALLCSCACTETGSRRGVTVVPFHNAARTWLRSRHGTGEEWVFGLRGRP